MMLKKLLVFLFAFLFMATTIPASAQEGGSFVLKRIKERGVINMGHREASVPFAFIGGDGKDKLDGKKGNDVLIGSTTDKDGDLDALDAVLTNWIDTGTLVGLVVTDDGDKDELKGGKGADLFFKGVGDKLKDVKPGQGDEVVPIVLNS